MKHIQALIIIKQDFLPHPVKSIMIASRPESDALSKILVAALVPAVLGLTACSGPRIAPNTERTTYLSEVYLYGAGGRQLKLEVRGNPFPAAGKPALEALVETAADGVGILQPPTHPRLQPDASARPGYRLVVSFSRQDSLSAQDLCDGKGDDRPQAGTGDIAVVMAFCVSGRAASRAEGWIDPRSPDDPDLSRLIKGLEIEVFRPDDTLQGSGGGPL